MHDFSTPWKHQITVRFSDIFRGVGKGVLGTNGLIQLFKAVCNNAILLKNANDVFVQF